MPRRFHCQRCKLSIDVPAGQTFVCPKCGGPMDSTALGESRERSSESPGHAKHQPHPSPKKGAHKGAG